MGPIHKALCYNLHVKIIKNFQRDLSPFIKVIVYSEKGTIHIFKFWGRLLDTDSELTLIQRDPKHLCGPTVKEEAYRSQILRVLALVHLPVYTVYCQTHPVITFPIPSSINVIDTYTNW